MANQKSSSEATPQGMVNMGITKHLLSGLVPVDIEDFGDSSRDVTSKTHAQGLARMHNTSLS